MSGDRYEITDDNGLRIDGIPWRERGLLVQYRAIRQLRSELAAAVAERDTLRAYRAKVEAAPVARKPWKLSEVTDAMAQRVADSFYGMDTFANKFEMREALQLWRKELGPALGLVEMREPIAEECERIVEIYRESLEDEPRRIGRAMFDAVRHVMWPKGGEG